MRKDVTDAIRTRTVTPESLPALRLLIADIARQVTEYGALAKVPAEKTTNVRNDMYLASEMLSLHRQERQARASTPPSRPISRPTRRALDNATKFIPTWVKVAVAIALGLGTMIGWKRIVVTVGEKIGKTHLTYGQGAAAEIVAMATIGAADIWGWPVSTTHVLSSGVAGTMAANKSGLQWSTIRNMLLAWVLTLPAAIMLAGVAVLDLPPDVLDGRHTAHAHLLNPLPLAGEGRVRELPCERLRRPGRRVLHRILRHGRFAAKLRMRCVLQEIVGMWHERRHEHASRSAPAILPATPPSS